MNWLRLHTEMKDNRQLQQMPAEMFRHLVNIWCIAKEYDQGGALPPVCDLAFSLRIEEDECKSLITKLVSMSLLLKSDGAVTVKNWDFWQYRDDSKNRVAALRKRKKHGTVTGDVTVGVTMPDVTVTLTEQSRAEQIQNTAQTVTDSFDLEAAFEELWNSYPAKGRTRKPMSQQYYTEAVATLADDLQRPMHARILAPVLPGGKWARSAQWAKGFIQGLPVYLNQQQWLESPEPVGSDTNNRPPDPLGEIPKGPIVLPKRAAPREPEPLPTFDDADLWKGI